MPKPPSKAALVLPISFFAHYDGLFNKPATPPPMICTSLSFDCLLLAPEDITFAITRIFTSNKSVGLASIPTQAIKSLGLSVYPLLSTFLQCVA